MGFYLFLPNDHCDKSTKISGPGKVIFHWQLVISTFLELVQPLRATQVDCDTVPSLPGSFSPDLFPLNYST